MAGENALMQAIAKKLAAKTLEAQPGRAAREESSAISQMKLRQNIQPDFMDDPNRPAAEALGKVDNVNTPTQSELQDIRGVPDQEFDEVKARDKPGPLLSETHPDPINRLLEVLQRRKLVGTSTEDPRGLSALRSGRIQPETQEGRLRQFFDSSPEKEQLLYEILGGTSRNPE